MTRRGLAGTGWKMNFDSAATRTYATALRAELSAIEHGQTDIFVLPPFTALHQANAAFAGSSVSIGGQNMHWEPSGAHEAEFDRWEWKNMADLPKLIVPFKKHVYNEVLLVFGHLAGGRA